MAHLFTPKLFVVSAQQEVDLVPLSHLPLLNAQPKSSQTLPNPSRREPRQRRAQSAVSRQRQRLPREAQRSAACSI